MTTVDDEPPVAPDYAREMMLHWLVGFNGVLHHRRGLAGNWKWSVDDRHPTLVVDEQGDVIAYCTTELQALHLARRDPADVEADAVLLEQLVNLLADVDDDEMDAAAIAVQAFRMIAGRFAGEPGYQAEWGPQ